MMCEAIGYHSRSFSSPYSSDLSSNIHSSTLSPQGMMPMVARRDMACMVTYSLRLHVITPTRTVVLVVAIASSVSAAREKNRGGGGGGV